MYSQRPLKIEIVGGPINLDDMPQLMQDRLAAGTLKAVKRFLAKPGGKEILDEEIRKINAERISENQ